MAEKYKTLVAKRTPMTEVEIFLRFILSLMLGALIGAERERYGKKDDDFAFGGLRSYMFIALLGALSAFVAHELNKSFLIVAYAGLVVILAISYYTSIQLSKGKSIGMTGEIAALLVFTIGVLTQTEFLFAAVAITIIVTTLLYLKRHLHGLLNKISEQEVYSTLIFAIVAFVILPFLPNETYGPLAVLNPYKIWLMVVFICGMNYVGYVLIRVLGSQRGIGLTGLLGGLASSTATAITFAGRSKTEKNELIVRLFVFATILANAVMFVRVAIEVAVINRGLLPALLIPLGVMLLVSLACAGYFFKTRGAADASRQAPIAHKSPFSLGPAIKFGILFAFVLLLVKAAELYLGEMGLYAASIISGLVDADAITLSMAGIAGVSISEKVATSAIILAVMSNTLVKFVYASFFGSPRFRKMLGISFLIVILSGLAAIWLL